MNNKYKKKIEYSTLSRLIKKKKRKKKKKKNSTLASS
jgi:hypothetical protein